MIAKFEKTTKATKPKQNKRKYAPQTPDTNRPDLGRPTPKPTTTRKNKKKSKS